MMPENLNDYFQAEIENIDKVIVYKRFKKSVIKAIDAIGH